MMLETVYSLLTADTVLNGMVKGIYFNYPDNFTELPAISFYMVQDMPINSFDGEIGRVSTISVDVWGNSAQKNIEIAERVRTILSSQLRRETETDLFEDNINHKSIQYVGTQLY